jgi:hypothetical protein
MDIDSLSGADNMNTTMKTLAAALITAVSFNSFAAIPAASAAQPKTMRMAIIGAGTQNCTAKLRITIVADSAGMVPFWVQRQGGPTWGPVWLEAKQRHNGKYVAQHIKDFPVVGPHNLKYRIFSGPVSSPWAPFKNKNC